MPLIVAAALAIKTKNKIYLRRLAVTEGWTIIPILIAVALAVAACLVPNMQAHPLHGVQFPCNFLLGLLQTVGRDIRRNFWPMKQRPSESRENLVPREGAEAQEPENLELNDRSNFDTDPGMWRARG